MPVRNPARIDPAIAGCPHPCAVAIGEAAVHHGFFQRQALNPMPSAVSPR